MRIAVTGHSGQVVSAMREIGANHGHIIIPVGRPELDLEKPETIAKAIERASPDIIVSAAAYTAVDKAEAEPDLAFMINAIAPRELARVAKSMNLPLIHLSTDYVFDGGKTSPYLETDKAVPSSVYGQSKRLGEQNILTETDNATVLRVAWIFSPFGSNFVKTMLRLAKTKTEISVVSDQFGGPTSAHDIAQAILTISPQIAADSSAKLRGVFHLPPEGTCSWADLADAVFQIAGARGLPYPKVNRILASQYPTEAKRPTNSRMDGTKIKNTFGITLPAWQASLDICAQRLLTDGQ